ncbi:MAG TPA: YCF48-related protein [Ignavibacteria bacterium]|nr:YCF48-related protein [Ignavibacteria bacterium]
MRIIKIIVMLICCQNISAAGWVRQSIPVNSNLYSINSHHGNNSVWACGENGVIIFSSDGNNWVSQNSGTTSDLYAIVFMEISGGPVFACGENGTMLYTTNNGTNWNSINMNTNLSLRDISDFGFVAVGDSGVIFKSSNNGMNWTRVISPVTNTLNAVSGGFSYYAVGSGGTIIAGLNQGQSWSVLNSGVANDLYGVPLFGNKDIAVGKNGLILRSTNFGTNWYSQNSYTGKSIKSVEYSVNNTSRLYCAGDSGLILKTTDYGNTWGSQISNTSENLNSIFFYLSDSHGFACGDNGTVLRTTDGGGVISRVQNESETVKLSTADYSLLNNYPNPFNPITHLEFGISKLGFVSLYVYDVLGNVVKTLINENKAAGNYEIEFDGSKLSSGIYFYSLFENGVLIDTKRMLLLK